MPRVRWSMAQILDFVANKYGISDEATPAP
jgi:hypothetical protein